MYQPLSPSFLLGRGVIRCTPGNSLGNNIIFRLELGQFGINSYFRTELDHSRPQPLVL